MRNFSSLWNQIEKYAIYAVGVIFISIQIVVKLIPGFSVDPSTNLILLATLLLIVFRYIDKNISLQKQSDISAVKKFTTDIVGLLEGQKIEQLRIFAHSGFKYYHAIAESKVQI